MGKYNVVQKQRRAKIQQHKRSVHGDPKTGKLKLKTPNLPISGKRKQKLLKKWRREQKEAIEKGLISMEDVEMAVAEGSSQSTSEKYKRKFPMKKAVTIKKKKAKGKGKGKGVTKKSAVPEQIDAMVE